MGFLILHSATVKIIKILSYTIHITHCAWNCNAVFLLLLFFLLGFGTCLHVWQGRTIISAFLVSIYASFLLLHMALCKNCRSPCLILQCIAVTMYMCNKIFSLGYWIVVLVITSYSGNQLFITLFWLEVTPRFWMKIGIRWSLIMVLT